MPVPDFQALMLPILGARRRQREKLSRAVELMADKSNLSREEAMSACREAGTNRDFIMNVSWAIYYLRAARSEKALARHLPHHRARPPSFGWRIRKPSMCAISGALKSLSNSPGSGESAAMGRHKLKATSSLKTTPDEQLEAAYKALRQALAQELLERGQELLAQFLRGASRGFAGGDGLLWPIEDAGKRSARATTKA